MIQHKRVVRFLFVSGKISRINTIITVSLSKRTHNFVRYQLYVAYNLIFWKDDEA